MEDYVEKQEAGGGKDDVVAEEELDPEIGIAVAGEDGGGGADHGQQSRNEDGEENEGEKQFAIAAADGERSEEDAVADESPCAERENQKEKPRLALNVEVVHDEEDGREDDLDDGDEEEVGDDLGEVELCAGSGSHALVLRVGLAGRVAGE